MRTRITTPTPHCRAPCTTYLESTARQNNVYHQRNRSYRGSDSGGGWGNYGSEGRSFGPAPFGPAPCASSTSDDFKVILERNFVKGPFRPPGDPPWLGGLPKQPCSSSRSKCARASSPAAGMNSSSESMCSSQRTPAAAHRRTQCSQLRRWRDCTIDATLRAT